MKKNTPQKFYTKSGEHVATGFTRVVSGMRGSYYEFNWDQMIHTTISIPPDQAYRITKDWEDKIFYYEYRTHKDNVKVYYQRKYVGYADYKPNMYYIATSDLKTDKGSVYNQVSLTSLEEDADAGQEEENTNQFDTD